MTVKIFQKEKTDRDEEWHEIIDLYWFEEQGVHDFYGQGHYEEYYFKLEIDGEIVFTTLDE